MPLSSLQGKAGLQQKGAKFAHEKLLLFARRKRRRRVEEDIPSDPEESDEVQGEPAVSDTENEELEQESVEEDLQQLLVREALPFLDRSYCGAK